MVGTAVNSTRSPAAAMQAAHLSTVVNSADRGAELHRGKVGGDNTKGEVGKIIRHLSPRQTEIARLVSEGFADKEVATQLGLSEGTVKIHLGEIRHRIGAKNRVQVARWWFLGGSSAPATPVEPVEWTAANVDLLRRLIGADVGIDVVRSAFNGRATDNALVPVLYGLLRERGQSAPS